MLTVKPFLDELRIGKAMLTLIKDPNRTEEIFKISEIGINSRDHKYFKEVMDHAMQKPEFVADYESKYLQGEVDLEELEKLPADSLGYAFARHLKSNGLSVEFYPVLAVTDEMRYLSMRARQSH